MSNIGRTPPSKPESARVRVVVKLAERATRDATGRAQSELRRVLPNAEFRDQTTRTKVNAAAIEAMRGAVERIAGLR
jgi:hypothetical protein